MDSRKYFSVATCLVAWILTVKAQMSPTDMMQLTSAVRQIVHPNAQISPEITAIAMAQGGPPTTPVQMLQYTPFLVNLAMQMGVRPPGTNKTVSHQALRDYIIARGNQWMNQQGLLAGMTGGQMGLGSEMTGFGGLTGGMGSMGHTTPMRPLGALTGGHATPMRGMGFSPMTMMLMDGGMEFQQLAMMNAMGGNRSPLSMMYLMQNM